MQRFTPMLFLGSIVLEPLFDGSNSPGRVQAREFINRLLEHLFLPLLRPCAGVSTVVLAQQALFFGGDGMVGVLPPVFRVHH